MNTDIKRPVWQRIGVVVCCALLLQPWGAYRAMGADVTPGYTFTSGERNVTHTKLNNAAAGTVNTTFYSGKGSAGANPNTAFEILLRDTSLDVFKKSTLADAVFDHTALLSARTAKTAPVIGDSLLIADSAAGNALKQMSWTNWMFSGAATGPVTNTSRLPALLGGLAGSVTLSDVWYQTNVIDGVGATVGTAATNDVWVVLQGGQLKKQAALQMLSWAKTFLAHTNIVQSAYTGTTNIATTGSGNWSNVTTIGSSALSNAITPRFTTSKVLVRVVLHADYAGISGMGMMRVLRNGSAIGVGDSDGGNRVEAGAGIEAADDISTVVWEWLDSPASTSAVGYNVQVTGDNSGDVYINRSAADSNDDGSARTVSTLTLTEVLQ